MDNKKSLLLNQKQTETIMPYVRDLPFDDFGGWFRDILDSIKPSLTMSIARGALRFLQLCEASGLLKDICYVSNHVIPFMRDDELLDKNILLFDDSVIYGSTMCSIKNHLEQRGALVSCSSYVVDRKTFYGETHDLDNGFIAPSPFCNIPLHAKHKLWPDDIRRHHVQLVQSILKTPLHYNLDFPTIAIELESCSPQDASYIAHLIRSVPAFRSFVDVSAPISNQCGIIRYSALFKPQLWDYLHNKYIRIRQYSKARITYAAGSNLVLITPIVQLAIDQNACYDNMKFSNKEANDLWRTLYGPHEQDGSSSKRALFRLSTAFSGVILGASIYNDIVTGLKKGFHVNSIDLIPTDMALILGEKNSSALYDIWNILKDETPKIIIDYSDAYNEEPTESPNNPNLNKKILDLFSRNKLLAPYKEEFILEQTGKVLLALRTVTDSPINRQKNHSSSRLETGLNYESILNILRKTTNIVPNNDDISLCIDFCIDHGLAVPKIIEENGSLFRAFYCGEDEDNQSLLQFKGAIHSAYTNFLKKRGSRHLTTFDFQKLCVALKDTVLWIPISTGPYKYGFTPTVGHQQLTDWLCAGIAAPFLVKRENNHDVIVPNKDYRCIVNPTWDNPVKEREFFDAFDYTATAFCKISEEAKLLLTTCRTHRHTFNAIAFELWAWIGDAHNSFESFLTSINKSFSSEIEIDQSTLCDLYWSIRYISEAWKKYRIFFEKYSSIIKELKKGFSHQREGGRRWWIYLKHQGLFEQNKEKDIEDRFKILIPLMEQITRIMIFVTKFLIQCRICSWDLLKNTFEQRGSSLDFEEFRWLIHNNWLSAAQDYNYAIEKNLLPTRSIIMEHLPILDKEKVFTPITWTEDVRKVVNKCFIEIAKAVHLFCPKYNTNDNDFPFAPLQYRRVLPDGSIEEDRNNVFILALDIIKGTHSEQTNEMKTIIRNILKDLESKGLLFQDTGDDKFIAWSEDVHVIWDAANVIRLRGESLKTPNQKFGGTRKGLYFGSIIMLKKPNGEILIHDRIKSNVIPAAFYILPGIDEKIEEKKRNSVIIIPDYIMKLFVDKLPIDQDNSVKILLEEKHFMGPCSIVNLSTSRSNSLGKFNIVFDDKKSRQHSTSKTKNQKS